MDERGERVGCRVKCSVGDWLAYEMVMDGDGIMD